MFLGCDEIDSLRKGHIKANSVCCSYARVCPATLPHSSKRCPELLPTGVWGSVRAAPKAWRAWRLCHHTLNMPSHIQLALLICAEKTGSSGNETILCCPLSSLAPLLALQFILKFLCRVSDLWEKERCDLSGYCFLLSRGSACQRGMASSQLR